MSGRDNAGQRVLNARRALCGQEECLENTFGKTLPDGAQCFVIEAQANYRFVANCKLPEDGEYVVMPKGDRFGRWVRSEGLVGFALLEGGKIVPDHWNFTDYTYQKVVQFEVTPEALVYIGSIPRLAHFSAEAQGIEVEILLVQGAARTIGRGKSASGAALVHPGAKIVVNAKETAGSCAASLQVILA
jgi:hypothetical protein